MPTDSTRTRRALPAPRLRYAARLWRARSPPRGRAGSVQTSLSTELRGGRPQVTTHLTGLSALTASGAKARLEISNHHQRPVHRTRLDAARVRLIGVVEEVDDQQACGYYAGESGYEQGVDAHARACQGELNPPRNATAEHERQPQRRRHRWGGLAQSLLTAGCAGAGQVEEVLEA